MHSIRLRSNRNIGAGINQQPGLRPRLPDHLHRLICQNFQITRRQVFLSKLNEIHAVMRGLGDLLEKSASLRSFVPGKLPPVGNVVEKQSRFLRKILPTAED